MAEEAHGLRGGEINFVRRNQDNIAINSDIERATETSAKAATEDSPSPVSWDGGPERIDPTDPRPEYRLGSGERAPKTLTAFVKLKEFETFYHAYADVDSYKQAELKRHFFDKSKLYARRWDYFYIYAPPDIQISYILLLPLPQAEHFLRTVNNHLGTSLTMPSQEDAPGLIFVARHNGTELPRYIDSDADPLNDIKEAKVVIHRGWLPESERYQLSGRATDLTKEPSDEEVLEFRAQMEALAEKDRKSKVAQKETKERKRHLAQKAKNHEMMRTQRYLGLRKANDGKVGAVGPVYPPLGASSELELELDKPTPFPQESSVVFICIDIEAYEQDSDRITEIGVATLDTLDIAGVAPGINGSNWFTKINARHYLMKENSHLENKQFIQGHRDGFVFGKSETIPLKEASRHILDCFKPPFSKFRPKNGSEHEKHDPNSAGRKIVFVGHDVKQDIDYLKKVNFDISTIPNIIEVVDTCDIYQAHRREINKTGLGNILLYLGLVGQNLHNGGNDAVYTLQAMIALAIKAEVEKKDIEELHKIDLEEKIRAARDHATTVVMEQKEGWDVGEDSDGGEPPSAPLDAFASKPKGPSQPPQQGRPRITDPVRGPWTGTLANRAYGPSQPQQQWRPQQPRAQQPRPSQEEYLRRINQPSWRPGIQNMRDEDIE